MTNSKRSSAPRKGEDAKMSLKAVVNVIGPSGELTLAGDEIPADWPEKFRRSLYESGGAIEDGSESDVAG